MIKTTSILTTSLWALAIAWVMPTFFAQPAAAQTATKLDCKNCIKSKQIKNGKVKGKDLKDGAVDGSKIASESVPSTDISNEPGVEFQDLDDPLTTSGTEISSLSKTVVNAPVSAPSDGFVTVVASGIFLRQSADTLVLCSVVNTGTTQINDGDATGAALSLTANAIPFGLVKTFPQGAGTIDYKLNCGTQSGTAAVINASITAMYFPTRY